MLQKLQNRYEQLRKEKACKKCSVEVKISGKLQVEDKKFSRTDEGKGSPQLQALPQEVTVSSDSEAAKKGTAVEEGNIKAHLPAEDSQFQSTKNPKMKAEIGRLEVDSKSKSAINSLTEQIRVAMEAEIAELKRKLNASEAANKSSSVKDGQVKAQLQAEVSQLQADMTTKIAANAEMKAEIEQLEAIKSANNSQSEQVRIVMEAKHAELQWKLNASEAVNKISSVEEGQAKAQLQAEVSQLQADMTTKSAANAEMKAEIERLAKEVDEKNQFNAELQSKNHEYLAKEAQYADQIQETKQNELKLINEIDALTKEMALDQRHMADDERMLAKLHARCAEQNIIIDRRMAKPDSETETIGDPVLDLNVSGVSTDSNFDATTEQSLNLAVYICKYEDNLIFLVLQY